MRVAARTAGVHRSKGHQQLPESAATYMSFRRAASREASLTWAAGPDRRLARTGTVAGAGGRDAQPERTAPPERDRTTTSGQRSRPRPSPDPLADARAHTLGDGRSRDHHRHWHARDPPRRPGTRAADDFLVRVHGPRRMDLGV